MDEFLSERRARYAGVLIFAAAFTLMLIFMDVRLGPFDEGIILTGGQLVESGAVPHRDFYTNYGPGQFYVLAGLFRLFGRSFIVARSYDVGVRAAIVAAAFHLLAGRCRLPTSMGVAAIIGLWMLGGGYYLYPIFPVLLLALWGTHIILPTDGRPLTPKRLMLAGALTGLSALFRYDAGFLVLVAHAVALGLSTPCNGRPNQNLVGESIRQFTFYGVGTAAAFLPPALILLALGAGPGFIDDMGRMANGYTSMRRLPFPGLETLATAPGEAAVYLPFATILLASIAAIPGPWATKFATVLPRPDRRFVITLGTLIATLVLKGLVRKVQAHMMLAIVPSTILIQFLIDKTRPLPLIWRAPLTATALLAIAAPITMALIIVLQLVVAPANIFIGNWAGRDVVGSSGLTTAHLPAVDGARYGMAALCAAELVTGVSKPEEPILVATGRHDKIFVNNVAFYFVVDRMPGTHWHQYDPGVQTRDDVQHRMIADIEKANVRWVVRDSSADNTDEPNLSAVSSGVRTLDRFIAQDYRPVAEFGKISVWLRNGEVIALPPPSPRCREISSARGYSR